MQCPTAARISTRCVPTTGRKSTHAHTGTLITFNSSKAHNSGARRGRFPTRRPACLPVFAHQLPPPAPAITWLTVCQQQAGQHLLQRPQQRRVVEGSKSQRNLCQHTNNTPTPAMGHYDELLQAADALGFGLQDAGSTHAAAPSERAANGTADNTDSIAQAQQLVEQCRLLHDLELRVAALAGHMGARDAADAAQLAARASAMASTADTLRRISASKDTLADRLRSASTRPSVPVAPHCQSDFTAMLRCAAASAAPLHAGMLAVQWAAGLDARPSCWEDQLRPIREAAASIRETLGSMSDFDAALAQRRGVAEAAAAGRTASVAGGGGGSDSGGGS